MSKDRIFIGIGSTVLALRVADGQEIWRQRLATFRGNDVTGVVLLGASGCVFMLIMLSSLAGMQAGRIPLTLLLVAVLYLGQEVYSILFVQDNVANFMHLVGGACGTAFGFAVAKTK